LKTRQQRPFSPQQGTVHSWEGSVVVLDVVWRGVNEKAKLRAETDVAVGRSWR